MTPKWICLHHLVGSLASRQKGTKSFDTENTLHDLSNQCAQTFLILTAVKPDVILIYVLQGPCNFHLGEVWGPSTKKLNKPPT